MARNALLGGLRPTHPGEILREDVLPALHRSRTEIAALKGAKKPQKGTSTAASPAQDAPG